MPPGGNESPADLRCRNRRKLIGRNEDNADNEQVRQIVHRSPTISIIAVSNFPLCPRHTQLGRSDGR